MKPPAPDPNWPPKFSETYRNDPREMWDRESGDPRKHETRGFSAGGGNHFFAYTEDEVRAAAQEAGLHGATVIDSETPFYSEHALMRFLRRAVPVRVLQSLDRLALRAVLVVNR